MKKDSLRTFLQQNSPASRLIIETIPDHFDGRKFSKMITSLKQEIRQHAPLKHIVFYLEITDTSLSRVRKEFKKKVKAVLISCHLPSANSCIGGCFTSK